MMIHDAIELILAMKSPNTKKQYRSIINIFENFVGKPINKIKPIESLEYFATLKRAIAPDGKPYADKTILTHFHALHSVCEHLMALDYLKNNPLRAVKYAISRRQKTQKRPTALIPFSVVRKILRAPEGRSKKAIRDRAILAVLFGAGLRRSEAIALAVDDVKVSPKGVVYLELRNSKAGRRQVRVVAKFARPYLARLISQRKSEGAISTDPLFVFYYASGKVRGRIDQLTLVRVFKKYCAIFGIKAAPHSARATFATKLKSMGYSDRDTADALGHLTEEMVRVYDKRAREVEDSPAIKLVY